ncbi:G-type lectin S-receptor-like serine/threonine-protein kinase LECRK3 [Camellia sinensis]|uniref:G-type lectin S-receptor-like serine/threonine-protein kinase LECRK3 n=1 Tax=Camellia sinensis TaxID=4442 RepID=UPI001035AA9B|nr:G-type lectin S-receptor-like serine/threonine-protein kinase LECRK3 [Camellia sinensis]
MAVDTSITANNKDTPWLSPSGVFSFGFKPLDEKNLFLLSICDSVNLWKSFKNPTDTMLPTQIMESGGVIFSCLSETNFSQGRFQLRMLQDGNLVLNTRDIPSNFSYDAYYTSGMSDSSNSSNSGYRTFNSSTKWTPIWSQPDNICVDIGGGEGSGACGFNSICRLNDNQRPDCKCPPGYSLLDLNNTYGSYKPNFTQSCLEDDINSVEDIYDFETLINTDWPASDYEQFVPATEAQCKRSCINDCCCAIAILGEGSCWKKLPLSNGREDNVVNCHAFLKFRKSDPRTLPSPLVPETKKNQGTLILVGLVLLGSSMFINFVLIGAVCLGFFLIHHRKSIKNHHGDHSAVETNLRCFAYKELVETTNGFKEELGSRAFGIVYKGAIQMCSRVVVAVKKLDREVQEKQKEFKTEVNISDFGSAKLLKLNQSKTNPATIRGTRGYVVAEWFNSDPITAKVDVYSYGVLLLEIISYRKSISDLEVGEEEKVILTYWACDCFHEGRLDTLVENDMEALNDWKRQRDF